MKRLLLFGMVAAVIILPPGLIGKFVERGYEETTTAPAMQGDALIGESFEGGWFRSQMRQRLAPGDPAEAVTFFGEGDRADEAGLVIDTTAYHGPLPLNGLVPGWARGESKLSMRMANGEVLELPGVVRSRLAFNGAVVANYAFDEISQPSGNGETLTLRDVDMDFELGPDQTTVSAAGVIGAFVVDAADGVVELRDVRLKMDTESRSKYLALGATNFQFGEALAEKQPVANGGEIAAGLREAGGKLDLSINLKAARLYLGEFVSEDAEVKLRIHGVSSAGYEQFAAALDAATNAGATEEDVQMAAMANTGALLADGINLDFEIVQLSLPEGEVDAKVNLSLPPGVDTNNPMLSLRQASGNANISVPRKLIMDLSKDFEEIGNGLNVLTQMGIVRREGPNFVSTAVYAKGELEVNGVPVPLPF